MSLQSNLQQAIRSALGCANDFNGDLHAMCDVYGIPMVPISGRLIPAAQKFDKSIDAMRSTVTSLTRTPGVGAMSDYETRLDQAKMPARSNYDEVTEQQLMELEALADGVLMGYGEMMGGAQQGAPQGKQEGGWMTLPNGVRVRRKQ